LIEVVGEMLPEMDLTVAVTKPCVNCYTPNGLPYIWALPGNERLIICAGGNSRAAKSSDELGRLAARLRMGEWDSTFDVEQFVPVIL
tara:strand:+ start:154 stop:414 length:261 start_codon:yes stop_codon:yes gene_type:complete